MLWRGYSAAQEIIMDRSNPIAEMRLESRPGGLTGEDQKAGLAQNE